MPGRSLSVSVLCAMSMQFGISTCPAQNSLDSLVLDSYWEQLFENVEQNDAETFAETIEDLIREPLDLNQASATDLNQIPDLGPLLSSRIVAYRNENGPFQTIEALQDIDGISDDLIRKIKPFLTAHFQKVETQSGADKKASSVPGRQSLELIQRLSRVRSRTDKSPERSSEHLYTRIIFRHSKGISVNLTLEKDPGEIFKWDPSTHTYGFDHISGNCTFRGSRILKILVIGDYTINTGHGLILSHTGTFLSGRNPVRQSLRNGQGISPYGSTDENNFFRGVAASFFLRNRLQTSIFISRHSLDASISDFPGADSLGFFHRVTSFSNSGLHRTEAELRRKDAIRENVFGGHSEYFFANGMLGFAGYSSSFSMPVIPDPEPFRYFDFSGSGLSAASIYGSYRIRNVLLTAEMGAASEGAPGGLASVQFSLRKTAEFAVIGRIYPRNFHSLHGKTFSRQSGTPQNEWGIYIGARLFLSPALTVAAYFDQYTFPWLRYGDIAPTVGYRALSSINYAPRNWLSVYAQYKMENMEEIEDGLDTSGRRFRQIGIAGKQSLRAEASYLYSKHLQLGVRFEYTRFRSDHTLQCGLLVLQDLRWEPFESMQLSLRFASYSIDGFQARIYAYEPDLRHAFSIPSFSGDGDRLSLLVSYKPAPPVTFQLKIAQTRQEQPSTMSEDATIRTPYPGELKAQINVRF